MKPIYIIITMALSTAVISWSILRNNATQEATNAIDTLQPSSKLQYFESQISTLVEQLELANTRLEEISRSTQAHRGDEITTGSYAFYPEQEGQVYDGQSPQLTPDEQLKESKRPKVMMVNPTPQQQQSYEVLKTRLDDFSFISNLNLQEFSSLPEVKNLPNPLKMVLISKAIEQYNRGNISRDTFLGGYTP